MGTPLHICCMRWATNQGGTKTTYHINRRSVRVPERVAHKATENPDRPGKATKRSAPHNSMACPPKQHRCRTPADMQCRCKYLAHYKRDASFRMVASFANLALDRGKVGVTTKPKPRKRRLLHLSELDKLLQRILRPGPQP